MPPNTSVSAERARELLRKNADLTMWMAVLGARGSTAAAGLASPGAPPPDDLVQELGEAAREFSALRTEVFNALAALGLKAPPKEAADSTKRLDPILRWLIDALETAELQAAQERARTEANVALDRVLALVHREVPSFAALEACQARAAELRAALATSADVDAATIAPFTALLSLMDGQANLDDDEWGALEDTVAAAFGRALAVAASRGKLLARS